MIEHDNCVEANLATGTDLQAAADRAATVRKPVLLRSLAYILTQTLTVRDDVALIGLGEQLTSLSWQGPTDGVALRIEGCWNYESGGFTINNASGSRGTSIGLLLTGPTPNAGTQGGNASWSGVAITNFATGLRVGESPGMANSEIIFDRLTLRNNDRGVLLNGGWNSLDFVFRMPSMSDNIKGIVLDQATDVQVMGGSASNNGLDFESGNGGTVLIQGFRSEGAGSFFHHWGTDTAHAGIKLTNCDVRQTVNPDEVAVRLMGLYAASIENSSINGLIMLHTFMGTPNGASLALRQSNWRGLEPFTFTTGGADPRVHYEIHGCHQADPTTGFAIAVRRNEEGYARRSTGRVPAWWIDPVTGVFGSNGTDGGGAHTHTGYAPTSHTHPHSHVITRTEEAT